MKAVLFANSPGEIASWVKPVVNRLVQVIPGIRIIIATPPCQWRSGGETSYCSLLPNVEQIIEPPAYLRYVFQPGFLPKLHQLSPPAVILHLGGELFYASLLQRRTRLPLIGYRQNARYSANRFQHLFVPTQNLKDRLIQKGSKPSAITVSGNLMIDSCESPSSFLRRQLNRDSSQMVVSLFPGSRQDEIRFMVPFLLETIESIDELDQSVRYLLALTPFAGMEDLDQILRHPFSHRSPGIPGILTPAHPFPVITTPRGTQIEVVHGYHHDLMALSDLMITIPGTKTMEAAFYGTPMLVIVPLQRAEKINIGGPIDFLPYLPVLGSYLKRYLMLQAAKRIPYTALPNQAAGELIIPELVGPITPTQVARQVRELLKDPQSRETMRKKLPETTGPGGAAARIADYCKEILRSVSTGDGRRETGDGRRET